jgi:hypothetical protein
MWVQRHMILEGTRRVASLRRKPDIHTKDSYIVLCHEILTILTAFEGMFKGYDLIVSGRPEGSP